MNKIIKISALSLTLIAFTACNQEKNQPLPQIL